MRVLLPIFVIAMTLSACSNKEDDSTTDLSRKAIGIESKTGRALTSKELCTDIKTDAATGKSTVDTLLFNSNSVYVKRTLMIDSQVQFVPVATSKGHWGLFNDSLIFNDKGTQSRAAIKQVEGNNGTTCYQIGNADAVQTFCPCN